MFPDCGNACALPLESSIAGIVITIRKAQSLKMQENEPWRLDWHVKGLVTHLQSSKWADKGNNMMKTHVDTRYTAFNAQSPIRYPHPTSRWVTPQSRVPLNSWKAFEAAHREANDRQIAYQHRGQRNGIYLTPEVMAELDPSWAQYLPANNLDARLTFAWWMSKRADEVAKSIGHRTPMFFVTVIVRDHTVREDEAVTFDVRRVQGIGYQWLRSCDYLAMVEGAFFTNFKKTAAGFDRAVSWHFHAVVWGVTETRLKSIIAALNRRYSSAISGIAAAHYRLLDPSEVAGQTLYMCKGNISSYKVWPRKRECVDVETGEVTIEGIGRFTQKKDQISSGEMARMYRVFRERYIDKLAFAGGAGKALLRSVVTDARRPDASRRRSRDAEAARRSSRRRPTRLATPMPRRNERAVRKR